MPRGNTPSDTCARTSTARRVSLAAVGVSLVFAVGLAGCTGTDPAPEWTPTAATPIAQPTPTPSPDPATIKPERPTAMNTFDSAGAEAVAVYYMDLYAYAYATGDLEEWRALSHPDCIFCRSVIEHVEAQAAAGQHSTGGTVLITDVSSLETDPGVWWSIDLEVVQAPADVRDNATGAVLSQRVDEVAYHMDLAIARDGDRWQVRAVDHREADQVEG